MAFIDPRQKQTEQQQNQISGGSQAATSATTTTQTDPQTEATTQTDPSRVVEQNQGNDFGQLLRPFTDKVNTARTNLNNAWSSFQQSAGADDPWDQTETTVLDRAISGGSADDLAAARGILTRNYSGPTTLSGSYRTDLNTIRDALDDTQSTSLLTSAVRQANPTLSLGQSRFDALLARQSPEFQSAATTVRDSVTSALGEADARETEARTLASNRANQAQTVRNQASNYLTNQRDTINGALQSQINAANAQNATVRNQYQGIQSNPQTGGGNTYNRSAYYAYTPGEAANRNNVATQQQATMWNNIADLLGDTDRINATNRTAASLDFNEDEWLNGMRSIVNTALANPNNPTMDATLGDQLNAYLRAASNEDMDDILNYAAGVNGMSQQRNGLPSYFYNNMANEAARRGMTNLVDPNSWVNFGNDAPNIGGPLENSLIEMMYGSRPDIAAARQADPNFNLAQWYNDHGRYGR